jgi:hypothetical protein
MYPYYFDDRPVLTPENHFASIARRLKKTQAILTHSIFNINELPIIFEELFLQQRKIHELPDDTAARRRRKEILLLQCEKLINYAAALNEEIVKLNANINSQAISSESRRNEKNHEYKSDSLRLERVMGRNVFKRYFLGFLSSHDLARVSGVCKLWQQESYRQLLPGKLIFLSGGRNIAMRLPIYSTLGDFNQARKEAFKRFF